jgi:hypothetical protein
MILAGWDTIETQLVDEDRPLGEVFPYRKSSTGDGPW